MFEWLAGTVIGFIVFLVVVTLIFVVSIQLFVVAIEKINGTHDTSDGFLRKAFSFAFGPIIAVASVIWVAGAFHWDPSVAEAEAAFYEKHESIVEEEFLSQPETYQYCVKNGSDKVKGTGIRVEEGFDAEKLVEFVSSEGVEDVVYDGNVWILIHPESEHSGYANVDERYLLNYDEVYPDNITSENLFMHTEEIQETRSPFGCEM